MNRLENINVVSIHPICTPREIHLKIPVTPEVEATVQRGRDQVRAILERKDPRFMLVVGPCSIHDPVAGLDYARRLKTLAGAVEDVLLLVMRVYFEKPRTTVGWKGLINDPHMDDSFHIEEGLERARQFLMDVNQVGLPAGTEALDPNSPQYYGDLISWTAIGARTTESQTHREMASGLSTPVGFKNGTGGDLAVAVNAITSASKSHSFLGLNDKGRVAVVQTRGNAHGHLVLRGGHGVPNYGPESVAKAEKLMAKAGLTPNIIVDCSHSNSHKKAERQVQVLLEVIEQVRAGSRSLVGAMLESNLVGGHQAIPVGGGQLIYGCSVTDDCLAWEETETLIRTAAAELRERKARQGDSSSAGSHAPQAGKCR